MCVALKKVVHCSNFHVHSTPEVHSYCMWHPTQLRDSISSMNGKAFSRERGSSHLLYCSACVHLSHFEGVFLCIIVTSFYPFQSYPMWLNFLIFLQWLKCFSFKCAPWNGRIYSSINSSIVQFNGFFTGPGQGATFLGGEGVFPGDLPQEPGGQEALISHTGNDPDLLPLSAPPSTQIGCIFHTLQVFTLESSLAAWI